MNLIRRLKSYRTRFAKERPQAWFERRYRLGDKAWDILYRCPVEERTVRRMERTFARLQKIKPPCYRASRLDHWLVSAVENFGLFPTRPFPRHGDPSYQGMGRRRNTESLTSNGHAAS